MYYVWSFMRRYGMFVYINDTVVIHIDAIPNSFLLSGISLSRADASTCMVLSLGLT